MRVAAPRSLQARLLLPVLAVVAAVWVLAAAFTLLDARHELDELLDGHLAQAAALLVVQQVSDLGEGERAQRAEAPELHRYAPRVVFQVFHEGRLLLRSARAPLAPLNGYGPGAGPPGFVTVESAGARWRVFGARGNEPDVWVFVGERIESRAGILDAVLHGTLQPLALALPLLALAVGWAVHRGLKPLRELSRRLAARAPQAVEPVQLPGAPSELEPLLQELNGLFARSGELVRSERRFTADAAHELRTPIAAIRAQAQVALGESDDAARRHALQAALAGCDRAAHLVDQLLTLARLEAGPAMPAQALDFEALVRHEVAALAAGALDKHQPLDLQAAPCQVPAQPALAAVLVRNLVDNAIRYSPPGAAVHVEVGRSGLLLRVQDGGPGLPPEGLDRLGERFYRALGSGADGSGLGWSIVRRIAAVQGWRVDVGRSAALGGLDVRVAAAQNATQGPPVASA